MQWWRPEVELWNRFPFDGPVAPSVSTRRPRVALKMMHPELAQRSGVSPPSPDTHAALPRLVPIFLHSETEDLAPWFASGVH